MKEKIILMVAGMLVEKLDPALLKKWADMGLDLLEDQIAKTPNPIDDKVVLPLIGVFRDAFGIPDND